MSVTKGTNTTNSDGTTTIGHTVGSGATHLLVRAVYFGYFGPLTSVSSNVDGALTIVRQDRQDDENGATIIAVLPNPTAGAHTITFSDEVYGARLCDIYGAAVESLQSAGGFFDDVTSVDRTVTTVAGGLVLDVLELVSFTSATAGGSQTKEGDNFSNLAASGTSTEMAWSWSGTRDASYSVVAFAPAAGGDPPDAPDDVTVTATSWDAIRVTLGEMPDGADDVDVYISDTTGVDDSDELVGTLSAPGDLFATTFDGSPLDPETTYYLRAYAVNEDGSTAGTQEEAETWPDDAVVSGTSGDPLPLEYEIPEGRSVRRLLVKPFAFIRAVGGLGRSVDVQVEVYDGETLIGDETFEDVDVAPESEVASESVWLAVDAEDRNETDAEEFADTTLDVIVTLTIADPE